MDLRHFQVFVAVVEQKSMHSAAEFLHVSQPSISMVIKEMEKEYHCLLFERLNRRIYITPAGRLLYSEAKAVLEREAALSEAMELFGRKSVIRIGLSMTIGEIYAPFLADENKKGPFSIHPYINNTREVEKKLLSSDLDIGFVEGTVQSHDLVEKVVDQNELLLAVPKGHPFFEKKVLHSSDLQGQRFAVREVGSGTRQLFEEYLLRHHLSIDVVWESAVTEVISQAVIKDGVLSVIADCFIHSGVQNGSIRGFRNKQGDWRRNLKLIWHKDKYLSPDMQAFIHDIEEYHRFISQEAVPWGELVDETCDKPR